MNLKESRYKLADKFEAIGNKVGLKMPFVSVDQIKKDLCRQLPLFMNVKERYIINVVNRLYLHEPASLKIAIDEIIDSDVKAHNIALLQYIKLQNGDSND